MVEDMPTISDGTDFQVARSIAAIKSVLHWAAGIAH